MIFDPSTRALVYIDSNIFINAFEAKQAEATLAPVFTALAKNPGFAATSEYTFGELLGREGAFPSWEQQKAFYRLLFTTPTITLLPVDRGVLELSGDLRLAARQEAKSRRLADAIHAATALICRCTFFLTADARLGNALPPPLRHVAPTVTDIDALLRALDA